jgi:hypothetical protein
LEVGCCLWALTNETVSALIWSDDDWRTLQRNQSPPFHNFHFDRPVLSSWATRRIPLFELRSNPCEVFFPPSCVGDDVESLRRVFGNDGIIDDTTLGIEKYRKRRRVRRQGRKRGWGKVLEECGRGWTTEAVSYDILEF